MGMRAARAARQGGSGDGSGEAVATEVVLPPSREYLEGKEMLPVLQQALEALSRECSRRGSQQDPRHKVNAIDWLATWLMRNNPSHNAETRAKLAARKNNPKFAIGAGISAADASAADASAADASAGAGDDPETRVKITLNEGGGARVAIQNVLPENGAKGTSVGKPNSSDLDAAAALLQGVAGSKLGPSAADLEKAAALIQAAATPPGNALHAVRLRLAPSTQAAVTCAVPCAVPWAEQRAEPQTVLRAEPCVEPCVEPCLEEEPCAEPSALSVSLAGPKAPVLLAAASFLEAPSAAMPPAVVAQSAELAVVYDTEEYF